MALVKKSRKSRLTPEQMKAAKAELRVLKKAAAVARKAFWDAYQKVHGRPRRRSFVRRFNERAMTFETWRHDYETLLRSTLLTPSSDQWSPAELAARIAQGADEMRQAVQARDPEATGAVFEGSQRRRAFPPRYRSGSQRAWLAWQSLFDELVHALSERTSLPAFEVVARAEAVADAARTVIEAREAASKQRKPDAAQVAA